MFLLMGFVGEKRLLILRMNRSTDDWYSIFFMHRWEMADSGIWWSISLRNMVWYRRQYSRTLSTPKHLVCTTQPPPPSSLTPLGRINWLITAKLREAALHLRHLATATEKPVTDEIAKYKSKVMQTIYGVLTLSLGAPPKPNDTFTWNFVDKEQKYRSITTTPLDYFHDNVNTVSTLLNLSLSPPGIADRFSLINDPRNPYMRLLTVSRLGNIVGGRGVLYVNVSMETIKSAVINMLKAGQPVFFGCDVGKYSEPTKGILDTALFDYELGFNVSLSLTKAQRLEAGESSMTHAMVLSGVNIVEGKPTKWRVENSWGDAKGEKGYLVMTDEWMDEFVYQAVVAPEFVGEEVRKVLTQEPIRLEIWDPMGSLA